MKQEVSCVEKKGQEAKGRALGMQICKKQQSRTEERVCLYLSW